MGGPGITESPTPQQLLVETWTFYSIGITLVLLRLLSRRLVVGSWKSLQIEDWLMLFDLAIYTVLMCAINISGSTATNLLGPGELETLTPDDIKTRIYGSKIVILLEQSMLITTYTCKACMLLLYSRLAVRTKISRAIQALGGYCACGFIATELAWFLGCRPFNGYWALPVPDEQCATYQHYSIVQAVFNISSDILMMCIAIPLISKARVPAKKKVLLVGIFSLGIFVIIAAILNKYYNFSNPLTTIYALWYIRESSVAIYVANIPMLWPLFRRAFHVGSFAERSTYPENSRVSGSRLTGSRHKSFMGFHLSNPKKAGAQELDSQDLHLRRDTLGVTKTTITSVQRSISNDEIELIESPKTAEHDVKPGLLVHSRLSFQVDEEGRESMVARQSEGV